MPQDAISFMFHIAGEISKSEKHHPEFWQIVEKSDLSYAIISAGKKNSYSHSSYEVVRAFHTDGYQVCCTNIVNGMARHLAEIRAMTLKLDMFGEIAYEYG